MFFVKRVDAVYMLLLNKFPFHRVCNFCNIAISAYWCDQEYKCENCHGLCQRRSFIFLKSLKSCINNKSSNHMIQTYLSQIFDQINCGYIITLGGLTKTKASLLRQIVNICTQGKSDDISLICSNVFIAFISIFIFRSSNERNFIICIKIY